MKHSNKRTIAGLMAMLMVLAVTIPALHDNKSVSEPSANIDTNISTHDMVRMVFCDKYGFSVGYRMDGYLIDSEDRIRPYGYLPDVEPCDNPFDTAEWAKVKPIFQNMVNMDEKPYHIRVYDNNDRIINHRYDMEECLVAETTIYPDAKPEDTPDIMDYLLEYVEFLKSSSTPEPTPTTQPVVDQTTPVDNAIALAPKIQVDDKPMAVQHSIVTVTINGVPTELDAIVLTESNGGVHTYYKLRDVGEKVGFDVGWTPETGITVDTRK